MRTPREIEGMLYDVLESVDNLVAMDFNTKLTDGEIAGLYSALISMRQKLRNIRKQVGDLNETR